MLDGIPAHTEKAMSISQFGGLPIPIDFAMGITFQIWRKRKYYILSGTYTYIEKRNIKIYTSDVCVHKYIYIGLSEDWTTIETDMDIDDSLMIERCLADDWLKGSTDV